jgi:hypothetical protein
MKKLLGAQTLPNQAFFKKSIFIEENAFTSCTTNDYGFSIASLHK